MAKDKPSVSCSQGTKPFLRTPTNRDSKTMWKNDVLFCKKTKEIKADVSRLEKVSSKEELEEVARSLDIPGRSKISSSNWKKMRDRWIEKAKKMSF